jgi:hypothetical protein
MIRDMIIVTTEGAVEVWAKTTSSLDRVTLAARDLETLKGISASIELAGASEDAQDVCPPGVYFHLKPNLWTMELDRTTFKIWFEFEVDGYLRYGKNEFVDAASDPRHQEIINKIRGDMGIHEIVT